MPRVNKKYPGLIKAEGALKMFFEFGGLTAKMYSCQFEHIEKKTIANAKYVERDSLNTSCISSRKTKFP